MTLQDVDDELYQCCIDCFMLDAIINTCYLSSQNPVPCTGFLQLALSEFIVEDEDQEQCFIHMFRVTPAAFGYILGKIQHNDTFCNNSFTPQAPVQLQLAVTLYWAGRYGNGNCVADVANVAGISEGSVINFTH